jgi:catechol 2,3-dioxygenase-like lactoylglutathione lyase family enzyme
MIEGLSHITFVVADLDRMERLVVDVLGAEKVYDSGAEQFSISEERFYLAGGIWIAVMKGDGGRARTYDHVAFKISDERFESALVTIERLGLDVRPPRPRVEGEGRSIYFHDWDDHLFELHTGTLAGRLERYRKGR